MKPARLYTIGHSNRAIATLLELLGSNAVSVLVDVRAFPRSRRHPQFNRAALEVALSAAGIGYRWQGDVLGGFRKPRADSPHTALTDAAFRGFADYMDTPRFALAATALAALGGRQTVAVMCAEADYQHCHRQFIADWLVRHGCEVRHIAGEGAARLHRLNACLDHASEPAVYNRHEQGDLFASPPA